MLFAFDNFGPPAWILWLFVYSVFCMTTEKERVLQNALFPACVNIYLLPLRALKIQRFPLLPVPSGWSYILPPEWHGMYPG